MPRSFPETLFSAWFLWHIFLKSTSSKSLYSFWTRLEWLKITHFLFGKLQTTIVEDQTWEMAWTKKQICNHWVLHRKELANLLGVFPEVVLYIIDFRGFFDVAFDPHIFSVVRFVVDRVAKLVLFVSDAEADDSPAPTQGSSLSSAFFLPPLTLGNSLFNSCVTDGYWFSSISHFAMFTKSRSDCAIFFDAFSLFIILE